ncbi:MAG: tetratricopeptide (TPR) repeat protein, partial [Mariniblastus sp.]
MPASHGVSFRSFYLLSRFNMSWHDLLLTRIRAIFFGRELEDDDMEIRERGYLAYVVISVLKFPFQVILFPLQVFKIFQSSEVDLDEDLELLSFAGRLSYRTKEFFCGVFRLVVWIVLVPFRLIGNLWMASFSDVVFVIPVFLMFGLLAFVFSQVVFNSGTIKNRYLIGIQNAMSQGDYQLAKTYFGRLLSDGGLTPRELHQWAVVLSQTGEGARADALINQLAPDDRSGFGRAHRMRALAILSTMTAAKDPDSLKRLHWHLSNSGDRSPEISRAWATYYLALEMHEESVMRLNETAELDPNNYLLIALIYRDRGQVQSMRFALKDARAAFFKILERDQLDQKTRIKLAMVYAQLEEYDNAEQCLLRGMRIQPDPDTKAALSDFYVLRHDLAREFDNEDVEKLLGFLIQAIDLNPNHVPIYERLMTMCNDSEVTPEKLTAIRKVCQQVVGGNEPTSLAHLALSNVLWSEGNYKQAKFHVEQAYQMDNKMVVVLNNLAWYIAHDE